MSYFAQIENCIVTNVIVADQEFIDSGAVGSNWVKTSEDGSFRGIYAGVGYFYDSTDDIFYPPSPHPSWILNKTTYTWETPIPYPTDGKVYVWKEKIINWVAIKNKTLSTGTQTL